MVNAVIFMHSHGWFHRPGHIHACTHVYACVRTHTHTSHTAVNALQFGPLLFADMQISRALCTGNCILLLLDGITDGQQSWLPIESKMSYQTGLWNGLENGLPVTDQNSELWLTNSDIPIRDFANYLISWFLVFLLINQCIINHY